MATKSDFTSVTRRAQVCTLPDGREIRISALGLKDWAELQDECLRRFKKAKLDTIRQNPDMFDAEERLKLISEVTEMQPDDMPEKIIKMPKRDLETGAILHKDGEPILIETPVPYTAWWMAETGDGWLYAAYLSIRREQPGMTLQEVDDIFCSAQSELQDLADRVGEISEPRLGKESPPDSAE